MAKLKDAIDEVWYNNKVNQSHDVVKYILKLYLGTALASCRHLNKKINVLFVECLLFTRVMFDHFVILRDHLIIFEKQ